MNETVKVSKSAAKTARRTETKEVRRQQLIDATITSIAKFGIGGTTMSTVTEAAGLSLGIVNFHFESKQRLFEETLVFLAKEYHDNWYKAYDVPRLRPHEKLSAIAHAHFNRNVCSRKKLAVWYAFFGESRRRAVYRNLIDHIDDERLSITTDLCAQIITEGGYICAPAEHIARTLEGLFDGLSLNILMYPDGFCTTDGRKQVHAFLASVFPKHFELPDF